MVTTLIALGIGLFVAVGVSVLLFCRDRKAKSLDKLGPRVLREEFERQREARRE